MSDQRISELFKDADLLYKKAMEELERGEIRDAAEKAWGAMVRATNALILARKGIEVEGSRGTSTHLNELIKAEPELEDFIGKRYFARESSLHGHAFYMGEIEPKEVTERRIKGTKLYIEDLKRLTEGI